MDLNEARRIYANLKPVYDVMGGDLVSACLEKGIPAGLLRAIMIEWRESEIRMNRIMGALRDDLDGEKQVADDVMKRFEDMHDGLGEIKPGAKTRPADPSAY